MEETEGLQARFTYLTLRFSPSGGAVKIVNSKRWINESSSRVSFAAETKIEETSE